MVHKGPSSYEPSLPPVRSHSEVPTATEAHTVPLGPCPTAAMSDPPSTGCLTLKHANASTPRLVPDRRLALHALVLSHASSSSFSANKLFRKQVFSHSCFILVNPYSFPWDHFPNRTIYISALWNYIFTICLTPYKQEQYILLSAVPPTLNKVGLVGPQEIRICNSALVLITMQAYNVFGKYKKLTQWTLSKVKTSAKCCD